ncbi:uncharacterized protein [Anabrus simplex]|uniref:uncharacterized protein isoform X4 n=1 Tax=Anabrus simplex TaxID=316456 RepID=UPI0035A2A647
MTRFSMAVLSVLHISSYILVNGQQQCTDGIDFYCPNSTSFVLCSGDIPLGEAESCQGTTVCSIACDTECVDPSNACTVTTTPALTTLPVFTCSAPGRFPDETNCANYYICSLSGNTFLQYLYTCPGGSQFDSVTRKCSLGTVICAGDASSSSSSTSTSTTPVPFTCPAVGRFPDENDPRRYYICTGTGPTPIAYHYTCPDSLHIIIASDLWAKM